SPTAPVNIIVLPRPAPSPWPTKCTTPLAGVEPNAAAPPNKVPLRIVVPKIKAPKFRRKKQNILTPFSGESANNIGESVDPVNKAVVRNDPLALEPLCSENALPQYPRTRSIASFS